MDSLRNYFKDNLENVRKDYSWNGQGYTETVCVKSRLHNLWKEANNQQERYMLAEQIVKDWGGIRSNKAGTIEKHVRNCQEHDENWDWPLQGIASYSKILAIKDPIRYAIYDSRVAIALNAAQYVCNACKGIIFNYVPRRKPTENKKCLDLFIADERFSKRTLQKERGWQKIPRMKTYRVYMETLRGLQLEFRQSQKFRDIEIYDLEMSLFANAECLAKQAIQKAESNSV